MSDKKVRVEVRPITDAQPDPHNANKHTQRGTGMLERSLRKRGFFRPIAAAGKGVERPVVMAGNLTQETAINAGLNEAIFVYTDGTRPIIHVREDLDPDSKEAAQLAIEDNRIAQVSLDFDVEILGALDGDVLRDLWTPIELAIMGKKFGDDDTNYQEAWDGMPEFENAPKSFKDIICHFKNEEDLHNFSELIGQNVTAHTTNIWYPEMRRSNTKSMEIQDES